MDPHRSVYSMSLRANSSKDRKTVKNEKEEHTTSAIEEWRRLLPYHLGLTVHQKKSMEMKARPDTMRACACLEKQHPAGGSNAFFSRTTLAYDWHRAITWAEEGPNVGPEASLEHFRCYVHLETETFQNDWRGGIGLICQERSGTPCQE